MQHVSRSDVVKSIDETSQLTTNMNGTYNKTWNIELPMNHYFNPN